MKKTEWIEEHNEEMRQYDKSMLSHDDGTDLLADYESNQFKHWVEDNNEDWYEPMGHFKD